MLDNAILNPNEPSPAATASDPPKGPKEGDQLGKNLLSCHRACNPYP